MNMMYSIICSALPLVLMLGATCSAEGLADDCAPLCARLDYEGKPEDCVIVCENLIEEWPRATNELPLYLENTHDKRGSSFVRIGKSVWPAKRTSDFVRIGRDAGELSDEAQSKRGSAFVRIGRALGLVDDGNKRSSFVRIGRAGAFVRIGKSLDEDSFHNKRTPGFVRIGRPSSFIRIGKSGAPAEEKRASSFVRIGKKSDALVPAYDGVEKENGLLTPVEGDSFGEAKRSSQFVRIGKSHPAEMRPLDDAVKRASSFVRIGKRSDGSAASSDGGSQMSNLNLLRDTRASSFVRIGKSVKGEEGTGLYDSHKSENTFVPTDNELAAEKKEASKRKASFVRIG